MIYDVAVVGGGLVGCSTALHLARRNAHVVLIERQVCGSQASGVNYGGVRRQGRNLAELPIAIRSRKIWSSMVDLVGDDCEFQPTGHLWCARNDDEMGSLAAHVEAVRDYDLDLDLMGKNRLLESFPWLNAEFVVGASYCATDGQANPRVTAPAFARAARAAGAEIHEAAPVTRVIREGSEFVVSYGNGKAIRAKALVNCAGAWGKVIAAEFGEAVPEEPLSPNMFVTAPVPYFLKPNVGMIRGDVYVRQIARGNLIIGGGLGAVDFDQARARPLPSITMAAARLAIQTVPRLASAQIIRSWSGIDGMMSDGIPVIGPSGTTDGLWHAFGFCGHGFQLAPAVGAILSELILDGHSETPIDAFSVGRFQRASDDVATVKREAENRHLPI